MSPLRVLPGFWTLISRAPYSVLLFLASFTEEYVCRISSSSFFFLNTFLEEFPGRDFGATTRVSKHQCGKVTSQRRTLLVSSWSLSPFPPPPRPQASAGATCHAVAGGPQHCALLGCGARRQSARGRLSPFRPGLPVGREFLSPFLQMNTRFPEVKKCACKRNRSEPLLPNLKA